MDRAVAYLRRYPSTCLEGLRKTMKLSVTPAGPQAHNHYMTYRLQSWIANHSTVKSKHSKDNPVSSVTLSESTQFSSEPELFQPDFHHKISLYFHHHSSVISHTVSIYIFARQNLFHMLVASKRCPSKRRFL